jgi:hypothetical protein
MRWVFNLARIVDRRNVYVFLLEQPERKRPFGILWRRRENNNTRDLQEEVGGTWTGLI